MRHESISVKYPVVAVIVVTICSIGWPMQFDHAQWRDDWPQYNDYGDKFSLSGKIESTTGDPGCLQLFFMNNSSEAVSLDNILWDGISALSLKEQNRVVWWQMMPTQVEPGQYGSVLMRLRTTPDKLVPVSVKFSNGETVDYNVNVPQLISPIRIESVGFSPDRQRLLIYFRSSVAENVGRIDSLYIGGHPVDECAKVDWLTAEFTNNLAAVQLTPKKMPAIGTYLYVFAKTDQNHRAAYMVHVHDGFFPLGTYDRPSMNLTKSAIAGMNTIAMHHNFSLSLLDDMAMLNMRAVNYSNYAPASSPSFQHSAMYTLLVVDEPDVKDYFHYHQKDDAPPYDQRVGHFAQDVIEGAENVRKFSSCFAGVLVDKTIKPFNWYAYGETADVIYQDNYVLTHGEPMIPTLWHIQQETMLASAPRPVIHVYDNCWQEEEGRGINRPKTASELRRLMMYPLGAGAKGLVGWWNVSAASGSKRRYHATEEFPDQWAAQSAVYQTLTPILPLLSISYPWGSATSNNDHIWIRTLVAGPDAVIAVVINEDFVSTAEQFRQRPQHDVSLTLPRLPWFHPVKAYHLLPGQLQELALETSGCEPTVTLPTIEAAECVLFTSKHRLADQLLHEYRERQNQLAASILAVKRQQVQREGHLAAVVWDMRLNRAETLVEGQPSGGAYRCDRPEFANPKEDKHNSICWYRKEPDGPRIGATWPLTLTSGDTLFCCQLNYWGATVLYELTDASGDVVHSGHFINDAMSSGPYYFLPISVTNPGDYQVHLYQDGPKGERGARIARWAYVLLGLSLDDLAHNHHGRYDDNN